MDVLLLCTPSLMAACLCSLLPLAELHKTQSVASQPLRAHPERGNGKKLLVDAEPRGRQKRKVSSAPSGLHGQQQQAVQEQRTGHEEEGTGGGGKFFIILSLMGPLGEMCRLKKAERGELGGYIIKEPSTHHPLLCIPSINLYRSTVQVEKKWWMT